MSNKVFDLIYDNDKCLQAIAKQFPTAVFEDKSDYVHNELFSVEIADVDSNEYYKWLVTSGWAAGSFHINLILQCGKKDQLDKLKGWVKIAKTQKKE